MIPLEDNHEDIIGKALRGLNLTPEQICQTANITNQDLRNLLAGETLPEALKKIAPTLNLSTQALLQSAEKKWHPNLTSYPNSLQTFTTPFGDMTVNAYLITLPGTQQAIAFDTGADATELLESVTKQNLQLTHLFLTHTHGDHIFDLDRILEKTKATAYVHKSESIPGTTSFEYGQTFSQPPLTISTLQTTGHSKGGTTYVIKGLDQPIAIVGDAIFAGSMGGGMISYQDALKTNLENIFTLPNDTILCPGHGPMTTVALEKKHNPFFAEKFN